MEVFSDGIAITTMNTRASKVCTTSFSGFKLAILFFSIVLDSTYGT